MPKKAKSSQPVDSNDNIVYSASASTASSGKLKGKSKKAQLSDVDALHRQPSSSSASSSVTANGIANGGSQFVAPIMNGKQKQPIKNSNFLLQAKLQTSVIGNTTTLEQKPKLPVLATTPAFESNISASEPNLLADSHVHLGAPVASLRTPLMNGYGHGHEHEHGSAAEQESTSEKLHAIVHNNPFVVDHEDLTTFSELPKDASVIFDDEDDASSIGLAQPAAAHTLKRDQLDTSAASVTDATFNVEKDSVLDVPLHSSLEQSQRIDRLEVEMVLPPRSLTPFIMTPAERQATLQALVLPARKQRKAFRSIHHSVRGTFKENFHTYKEDVVLSFEDEMERERRMPAHTDRLRFLKRSRTEISPELEPEKIFDQSIKAHRHRPPSAVPQMYVVKRNDATRRYERRVSVRPLQDMRYEEGSNETVYSSRDRAAQKRLVVHVEKVNTLVDSSPMILPDAIKSSVSGSLIRELRHLFEDFDDVSDDSNSSLANAVKNLVCTNEPLPYLMMPAVRSGDGTERLFQVCPPHLAPNVDDEVLPARPSAETPKLDANVTPFDQDGFVHHFHYAFIPFNIYRDWLKRQPQFAATMQRPIVLHDDLARFFVPLPTNVQYAKVVHCAYEKISQGVRREVAHAKVSMQPRCDVHVASLNVPVIRTFMRYEETVKLNVVQHRVKSERNLNGERKPIRARVAENDLPPSSTPQYVVVASRDTSWNPFYKQSHGLVKECGVGTMDDDGLEEFEIDPNVIDALFEDTDSDDDDKSTIGKDSGTSTDHYASPHRGTSVSTGSLTAVHEAYSDDSRPPSPEETHLVVKLSARARYK